MRGDEEERENSLGGFTVSPEQEWQTDGKAALIV